MSTGPATAVLLLTGDELLRGFVQDANTGFLAERLRRAGIELEEIRVVADDLGTIVGALERAAASADLVVVCGGLGPTHDDRTSEAVAAASGRPLELREDALAIVEARVRAYGRMRTPEEIATFDPGNRKQATLPQGATMLEPLGTAPGYLVRARDARATTFAVLPGPPSELRHAWFEAEATEPIAALAARAGDGHERLVRIWGVPELRASQVLASAGHVDGPDRRVTLCARDGELELSVRGTYTAAVDELVDVLADAFGAACFALDDERPVARIVGALLQERGERIATAESCTAGLLGAALTEAPGSSAWVVGGVLAYANEVKQEQLGVSAQLLAEHGAVSEPVALAMADGVRERLHAEVGVSITGIAGPGGGSGDKPVGTVHVAVTSPGRSSHRRVRIPGDRATVRRRSVSIALHLVRELLDEA